jgi:hypothetical protein
VNLDRGEWFMSIDDLPLPQRCGAATGRRHVLATKQPAVDSGSEFSSFDN